MKPLTFLIFCLFLLFPSSWYYFYSWVQSHWRTTGYWGQGRSGCYIPKGTWGMFVTTSSHNFLLNFFLHCWDLINFVMVSRLTKTECYLFWEEWEIGVTPWSIPWIAPLWRSWILAEKTGWNPGPPEVKGKTPLTSVGPGCHYPRCFA